MVLDGSNYGGWCTAGVRPYDYSGTGGFYFLGVFQSMQRYEYSELLGSHVFFPNFLQDLAKEYGYKESAEDFLEFGNRSSCRVFSTRLVIV